MGNSAGFSDVFKAKAREASNCFGIMSMSFERAVRTGNSYDVERFISMAMYTSGVDLRPALSAEEMLDALNAPLGDEKRAEKIDDVVFMLKYEICSCEDGTYSDEQMELAKKICLKFEAIKNPMGNYDKYYLALSGMLADVEIHEELSDLRNMYNEEDVDGSCSLGNTPV